MTDAQSAIMSTAPAVSRSATEGPVVYDNLGAIAEIADRPAGLLLQPAKNDLSPEEQAHHRVYLLLVMKMVRWFWNGNKNGAVGTYHYRGGQYDPDTKLYDKGMPYYGHNIVAIAVNNTPNVTDFDFNHAEVFSSSIEHAEARLIRRLYSLTGLTTDKPLKDHSVYTTLEPCAQCAGIMALAGVKEVVYLQPDDGTRRVTNILYNLKPYSAAVKPILAKECGVVYGEKLEAAYGEYQEAIMGRRRPFVPPFDPPFGKPFWEDQTNGRKEWTTSIASFLCTDGAREIYDAAARDFDALEAGTQDVDKARAFFQYAVRLGHRGTPH